MMQFFKDNMWQVLGGIVVVGGLFYYFYLFGGSSSSALLMTSGETSPVSQELLATLSSLHTIKLDDAIFRDPVFISLSDFGVQIAPENIGRRNPFAPLPASSGSPSGLKIPAGVSR